MPPTADAREERREALLDAAMLKRLDAHMKLEDDEKDRKRKWHIGKELPLALIAALVVQTLGVIWGAALAWSQIQNNKDSISRQAMIQNTVDMKQDRDALASEGRIMSQLDKQDRKLDRLIESRGLNR